MQSYSRELLERDMHERKPQGRRAQAAQVKFESKHFNCEDVWLEVEEGKAAQVEPRQTRTTTRAAPGECQSHPG